MGGIVEREQVGEVSKVDVRREVAHRQLLESDDAELVDENVDERAAHVWRVAIELKESGVVALGEAFTYLEGVLNWLGLLLFSGQRLQHADSLRL